jgi:serine/threonine-protein kinase|nr:protein kinase [Kofleriaceae bacterium]
MATVPAGAGSLLGKRLGKYEVLALLALGGTAEIYLARIAGAAGFEKYVVVKCLHDHLADDQEFVKMFLDEARLAAHLDHSNIVQTFELGEYQNRYYMVMEFLAGLSLAMIVRRVGERASNGRMPVPLVLNLVAQACAGLHYAHEKGINGKALNIVHRDISPQNLVVSFEGVVKVVDFGIAKAELRETRTRSGTIKGKFAYMSPEQCVANNVDRRTDVFALGVIAHELLTGRRLFKRPSPYETYQAVIECAVEAPSAQNHELDPGLDPLIMKAVAKDKEQRYPTAEAFGDALQSYLHHRGKGSGPSDVGRFIDEAFQQELDEHGARMRELIEGRVIGAGGWDEDEDPASKQKAARQSETVALRQPKEQALAQAQAQAERDSEPSLNDDVPHDDSDMPADRTRIETNPLERHSGSEIPTAPVLPHGAAMPPPGQLGGPLDAGAGASRPKFPAAAQIPTMIAEPDDDDDDDAPTNAPEFAPTAMGAPLGSAQGQAYAARPPIDPRGATAPVQALGHNGRHSAPMPQQLAASASAQQPTVAVMPGMSQPMGAPPMPPMGPGSAPMQAQMQQRPVNVYDTGPYSGGASGPAVLSGSPEAARMMSPVGDGYPQVDWAEAAALPIRVVPPWMLALLFVAALGVALGLTVAIAQLIR